MGHFLLVVLWTQVSISNGFSNDLQIFGLVKILQIFGLKGQIERKISKSKNLQNFDLLGALEIRRYEKLRFLLQKAPHILA